jgi:hypothetical protein
MAALNDVYVRVAVARGCLQGGVLSLLLRCLVVDDLIARLNTGRVYCQGYADDICLLAGGKFPNTVSELMQGAIHTVGKWCDEVGLSVSQSIQIRPTLSFLRRRGNWMVSLNLFCLESLCTVLSRSGIWG